MADPTVANSPPTTSPEVPSILVRASTEQELKETNNNPDAQEIQSVAQKVQEGQPLLDPPAERKPGITAPPSPAQLNAIVGWIEANKRRSEQIPSIAADILKQTHIGEGWENAISVFAVCFFTYLLRWMGLGVAWCFPIWAVFVTYHNVSVKRFKSRVRDDTRRHLQKQRLENSSESETVEWLNNFLGRFWLIYEPVLSATIQDSVNPVLESSTPSFLEDIKLTHFSLGSTGPQVDQIRTYTRTEQDEVLMDWDLKFAPGDSMDLTQRQTQNRTDPKIILTIRVGKGPLSAGMPILVENIEFTGQMRLRIKFMNNFPHIKLVEFSFLDKPTIRYALKPIGGETFGFDIANMPGLQGYIKDTIHWILEAMMYSPNWYTLDIDAMMNGPGYVGTPFAVGVMKICVRNAKGLKAADMFGKSDPYVRLSINDGEELARTTTKDKTLAPFWDETFFVLINSLGEILDLDVFDWNKVGVDEKIGASHFELSTLVENPEQEDVALQVKGDNDKEAGEMNIGTWYYPVAEPIKQEDGTEVAPESNVGILRITIHQAKELDAKKSIVGHLNPYCILNMNDAQVKKTKIKKRTNNPNWEDVTEVFCTDLAQTKINLQVKDDRDLTGDPLLGTWDQMASTALEKTKNQQDWYALGNARTGKVRLNVTWRPIILDQTGSPLTGYRLPIGVVRIHVKEAAKLHNTDLGGTADPYCRVRTGTIIRGKTRIIDSNLNPDWDEVLYIPISRPQEKFLLEVMDWNHMKKDSTIGVTEVDVGKLLEKEDDGYASKGKIDLTEVLTHDKDKSRGTLHFSACFYPIMKTSEAKKMKDEAEATLETEKQKAAPNAEAEPVAEAETKPEADVKPEVEVKPEEKIDYTKYKSGVMAITILGATGFEKKRDLFTQVQLNGNEYSPALRTRVQKKTVEPKFNEIAEFFVKETEFETISILFQERGEGDPVVAKLGLTIFDLLRDLSEKDEVSCRFIAEQQSEKEGSVSLKLAFIPIEIEIDRSESMLNMGIVTLKILEAKNLPAADSSGTSDPYVTIYSAGTAVYKTKTIKKNLNPSFQEQTQLAVPSLIKSNITFKVSDWDMVGSHEVIGEGRLDLSDLEPREMKLHTVPLINSPQSTVSFQTIFVPGYINHNVRRSTTLGAAALNMVNPVAQAKNVMSLGTMVGKGAAGAVGGIGKGAFGAVGAVGKGVTGVFGGKKKDDELIVPEMSREASLEDERRVSREGSIQSKEEKIGKLIIGIIEARDLKAVDSGGTSDPYVKIYVGKKEVYKTKHISKNLNPQWNEQTQISNISLDSPLLLEVKDHNRIGINPTIGEYTLDIGQILDGNTKCDWWTEDLRNGQGQLHLQIEFIPGASGGSMTDRKSFFFKK